VDLPGGTAQMSMEILEEGDPTGTSPGDKYIKALQDVFKTASTAMLAASGLDLTDPWTAWKREEGTGIDSRDWARQRISSLWNRLSPIGPWAHPALGATRLSQNYQPVHVGNALAWIRIESHNDDARDGSVFVKYDGTQNEEKLWPNPKAVPATIAGPTAMEVPSTPSVLGKRGSIDSVGGGSPAKRGKTTAAPLLSASASYSPLPGTGPDENDSLMQINSSNSNTEGSTPAPGTPSVAPIMRAQPGLPSGEPRDLAPQLLGEPPDLKAPYYFIASSFVKYDLPPDPAVVKQLQATDPLDEFLSGMHLQGIILTGKPESGTAMEFHSQDEAQAWMSLALSVEDSPPLGMTVTTTDSGDITVFTLQAPALGCVFSSAVTADILGTNGLGPAGTVPVQGSVILGLQSATKISGLSLKEILDPGKL